MSDSSHKSQGFRKAVDKLFKIIEIVIAIFLGVMIFFTFLNVMLCQFNLSFAWNEEVTRICLIYLVYLGLIITVYENRHLMADTMIHKVPPRAQRILYIVIQGTTIWLMGVLATGAFQDAWRDRNDFQVATHFSIFMMYFTDVLPGVSVIIISLVNLYRMFFLKESVLELSGDRDGDDVSSDDGELGEGAGLQ